PRHRSPYAASLAQSGFTLVVIAAFAVAGLDPYRNLVTVMSGLSTLGIVLLQMLTAVACVVDFRRRRDPRTVRTLVLPLAGCAGLIPGTVLRRATFGTLAHSDALAITVLPYLAVLLAVGAALYALRLRGTDPDRYARIGASPPATPADTGTQPRMGDADGSHAR